MPYGDVLFQRLRAAQRGELEEMLVHLKLKPEKYANATKEDLINALSSEIRSAAGNSFRNLVRDEHELSYKHILVDVFNKIEKSKARFAVDGPESESLIEDAIEATMMALIKERLEKMSPDKRQQLQQDAVNEMKRKGIPQQTLQGVSAFLGTGMLVSGVSFSLLAPILFGSLWTWLFGYTLGQIFVAGILGGGPAGLLIGGVVVASGASYSKIIPIVLRLMAIRKNAEAEQSLSSSGGKRVY